MRTVSDRNALYALFSPYGKGKFYTGYARGVQNAKYCVVHVFHNYFEHKLFISTSGGRAIGVDWPTADQLARSGCDVVDHVSGDVVKRIDWR